MPQMNQLGKANTTVRSHGGVTVVTLHSTDVVTITRDSITLNTGGWQTAATRTRMNQAANQFGLGYRVSFSKGEAVAVYNGTSIPFPANGDTDPRALVYKYTITLLSLE